LLRAVGQAFLTADVAPEALASALKTSVKCD
jgi:hypothetical protein